MPTEEEVMRDIAIIIGTLDVQAKLLWKMCEQGIESIRDVQREINGAHRTLTNLSDKVRMIDKLRSKN